MILTCLPDRGTTSGESANHTHTVTVTGTSGSTGTGTETGPEAFVVVYCVKTGL